MIGDICPNNIPPNTFDNCKCAQHTYIRDTIAATTEFNYNDLTEDYKRFVMNLILSVRFQSWASVSASAVIEMAVRDLEKTGYIVRSV